MASVVLMDGAVARPVGPPRGGRREYVHVGSAAAVLAADGPVERHDRPFGELVIQMALSDDPADHDAIRARALKLLARREHASGELVRKLVQRGFDEDAVTAVTAALEAENLLSEARFAESLARSRAERGYGPLRIRSELSVKGVDEDAIGDALAALEVDWGELAGRVRRKRFGPELPRDFPAKAKQMRFLQQRGFDADAIRRVFK